LKKRQALKSLSRRNAFRRSFINAAQFDALIAKTPNCEYSRISQARYGRKQITLKLTCHYLLLGATGYIGQAFVKAGPPEYRFHCPDPQEVDYTRFETFLKLLRDRRPDSCERCGLHRQAECRCCEIARADTLQGNARIPANYRSRLYH